MKRYAMRADISQAPIVSALRQIGDKVDIIGRPVDLLVRSQSRYWTAEVKTPGKHVKHRQQAQIDHAEDATAHDAPHFVLTCVNDAFNARHQVILRNQHD
jgi:hypothetical protein